MEQGNGEIPTAERDAAAQLMTVAQLRRQLAGVMRVDTHEVLRPPDEAIAFRGQIEGDTEAAFEQISQRFADAGYIASLRDSSGGDHEVVAVKGAFEHKTGQVWVNVMLLLVTVFSVLFVGAGYAIGDTNIPIDNLSDLQVLVLLLRYLYLGIPFTATLMGILLAHELSHYFVGRLHGSPQSLPYFIPFPNLLFGVFGFGTMGALIVQRKPMQNRKALLDIGIAGPLGGLIVAIPLLIIGLALSDVGPPPAGIEGAIQEGNSLLYAGLKYLVFGRFLPAGGEDVWLHPIAFAAWAGLFITMLNLVPIGQLDGGHVSYALLGRKAWTLGHIVIGALIVWGGWLTLNGNGGGGIWMMWGFLNLILNRRHPLPLDDVTKLDWRRVALGVLLLIVFVILFMPAPLQQVIF
jgi:membrane-associated protease RseP (regulator of RpoE activity)